MERYIKGKDRRNYTYMPKCLEEYIEQDNIVRVIDAVVDYLDLEELNFKYAKPEKVGRKPYNPADLLKLYIYGYLNGCRSSRKLERESKRNIEVKWLINDLQPHNKTIANFRRENLKSLELAFGQFLLFCDKAELLGKDVLAVDGSKIRANNSRHKYMTKGKANKLIEHYKDKAREYLELLEKEDEIDKEEVKQNIRKINERIEHYESVLEVIKKEGSQAYTDSDSKMMKTSNDGSDIAHNVQIAVDGKENIVVAVDVVSKANDYGQLTNMVAKAKKNMNLKEADKIKALADKGYSDGNDLVECEKIAETYVAKREHHARTGSKKYSIDNFKYIPDKDIYICPEGQELIGISNPDSKIKKFRNKQACKNCPCKELCTDSEFRLIDRKHFQDVKDRVNLRTINNKELYRRRQMIVEPVFGTVKRALGLTYFLTIGNENVKADSYLFFFSYNILRARNALGNTKMIQKLKDFSLSLLFYYRKRPAYYIF